MDYSNYNRESNKAINPNADPTSSLGHEKKKKIVKSLTDKAIHSMQLSSSSLKLPHVYRRQSKGSEAPIPTHRMVESVAKEIHKSPSIEIGLVKGPHYGPKEQQRDKKVQSAYHSIKFYEHEGKSFMRVEKAKDGHVVVKKYEEKKKLGSGTFGRAYLYVHAPEEGEMQGKSKVVKRAKGDYAKEEIKNGAQVLKEQHVNPDTGKKLSHVPGLMSKVKIVANKGNDAVLSLYDKGDLKRSLGKLPPKEMINATSQLLFGLNHLHTDIPKNKVGRAHRDIKPENIFHRTDKSGGIEYAIADIDGAHPLTDVNTPFTYTPGYLSSKDENIFYNEIGAWDKLKSRLTGTPLPRTFQDYHYLEKDRFNTAHDVYSMGLTLRQLLVGRHHLGPIQITELDLMSPLKFKDLPINKKTLTAEQTTQLKGICDLINKMTDPKWEERITAEEAFSELKKLGIAVPEYPA